MIVKPVHEKRQSRKRAMEKNKCDAKAATRETKTAETDGTAVLQGFQGSGVHLSMNRFEIIRESYGLIRCVFMFLRIGAP